MPPSANVEPPNYQTDGAPAAASFLDISLPLVLGCALIGMAWLVPGHYLPWPQFQQEGWAAAGGLLLALTVPRAHIPPRWPALALCGAALAAVPWIQFAAGQLLFLVDAVLSSAYLAAFALAACVGASIGTSRLRGQLVEGLGTALFVAAAVSAGLATWQWLGLQPPNDLIDAVPLGTRPVANIAQPNHLCSLLALALTVALRWYEAGRIRGLACALACSWLAWGMVLTQSRTGWLFVTLLALSLLALRARLRLRTTPLAILAGTVMFALLTAAHGPLKSLWLLDPVLGSATAPPIRTEVGTRLVHWQTLADAVWHAPWAGYGWNQVSLAQYDFAPRHPASGEYVVHSHNLVLDMVLYNGLPLGLLVVVVLGCWFVQTALRLRTGSDACLFAGLLAIGVHSMLEYPLHYAYFLVPAGLLVGLLDTANSTAVRGTRPARPLTLWGPALALTMLLMWIAVEYMRAEEALRRLRFATARISLTMADLRSPNLLLLDGWKAYHDAAVLQPRPNMSAGELALLNDVARRYTYAPALRRYAHALALNGQALEARDVLSRICKTYPPPIQAVVRESWRELQVNEPALNAIAFPDCADLRSAPST